MEGFEEATIQLPIPLVIGLKVARDLTLSVKEKCEVPEGSQGVLVSALARFGQRLVEVMASGMFDPDGEKNCLVIVASNELALAASWNVGGILEDADTFVPPDRLDIEKDLWPLVHGALDDKEEGDATTAILLKMGADGIRRWQKAYEEGKERGELPIIAAITTCQECKDDPESVEIGGTIAIVNVPRIGFTAGMERPPGTPLN